MSATDIITLAEAREAVNLASGSDDTILAGYVSAASMTLDALCGPVVQRTVTETHPVGQCDEIMLRMVPVASITSVVEYASDGSSTTLTAETVSSKPANGYLLGQGRWAREVERRSLGVDYLFPYGGNVVVTYVAGRAASTSAVDAKFKTACKMLLANMWRFERGTGTQTFGGDGSGLPGFLVPNAVSALLADELLPPGVA